MKKSFALFAAALVLTAGANIRSGYTVTVGDEELSDIYSAGEIKLCCEAAAETAREICGTVHLPEIKKQRVIMLSAPDGDEKALTDAILRRMDGIELLCGVYVNDRRLGCVRNGDMLSYLLERNIDAQMPNAAVSGDYSGEIILKTEYCAKGSQTAYSDMLLLIEGAAPVIYIDDEGERA